MDIWLFILTIIIIIYYYYESVKKKQESYKWKRLHIDSSFSSETIARVITSKND